MQIFLFEELITLLFSRMKLSILWGSLQLHIVSNIFRVLHILICCKSSHLFFSTKSFQNKFMLVTEWMWLELLRKTFYLNIKGFIFLPNTLDQFQQIFMYFKILLFQLKCKVNQMLQINLWEVNNAKLFPTFLQLEMYDT